MTIVEEKKVYNVTDIQHILGMGRNRVYEFIEKTYKNQTPFRVLKFGKLYKIPKEAFDNWLNGHQYMEVEEHVRSTNNQR